MQTFTLFFGFAIVAIAMENLASKLQFVKTSDADAKGLPKFQSRADEGLYLYTIRGVTGKEKVTVTDGKETNEYELKEEKRLNAKNPKIVIDYTNDECCMPDMNVMFKPGYPIKKISTADNPFPQNFETKWNCSACQDKSSRMDLTNKEYGDKDDRCWAVRETADDFCDNCKILNEGQFCHSGKYTIEFDVTNQCEGVTFGECKIPPTNIVLTEPSINEQECSEYCGKSADCFFFRYNHESGNCTLMDKQNRGRYCNIWAGPMEKSATACLNVDNEQFCDYQLEEECDYNGKLLKKHRAGQFASPADCQDDCKRRGPDCKSWIYNLDKSLCILMRDEQKKCTTLGGLRRYTVDQCNNMKRGNSALKD